MWKTLKSKFDSTDSLVSLVLGLAVVLVIGMTIVNYVKSKTQVATSTTKQEQAAAATGTTGETASLPTKYVVKAGDTLWSIAQVYYKSGYNWVSIQSANTLSNPNMLDVGTALTIPVAATITPGVTSMSTATTMAPKEKSYTVQRGDDLWNVAVKEYGDGYRWVDIAKANNLSDPDVIFAGNVLMMP